MKKLVYLCDLVHDYIGAYTYMFPLNVGYLASYANKEFIDEIDIRIFKFPNDYLNALSEKKPDLVGFSSYMWSSNLNNELIKFTKKVDKNIITISGGPHIKYDEVGLKNYFEQSNVDYFVPYQGETAFNLILKMMLENRKGDLEPLDGTFFNLNNEIFRGKTLPRIKDLETIPSPYLSGILDKFFDTKLIPIIETNRGCPFRCTFCAQGLTSFNSVMYFSLDRVREELDYVRRKVKHTNLLHFADANFGIKDRDLTIAQEVDRLRSKHGYPEKISSNMAKNRPPEKMIEISRLLGNTQMVISLQSLDDLVLDNVKRKNIKNAHFIDIIKNVNDLGGVSGTEIILGLPGETFDSHLSTIRKLFEMNVSYIIAYNALVLDGTEMDMDRNTGKFTFKTKFRLIDSSFGEYDFPIKFAHNVSGKYKKNITAFEFEEGVRETETLSESEILYFRPIHWLIQFMWNYRFYYNFLKSIQQQDVNPIDIIQFILKEIDQCEDKNLKDLFNQFYDEAEKEWFDSPEDLYNYYSKKEQLIELKNGSFGKMNGKYIFIVSTELKDEFHRYLLQCAKKYKKWDNFDLIAEALNFDNERIINMKSFAKGIPQNKKVTIHFNQFKYGAEKLDHITLTMKQKKIDIITTLMKQYRHDNLNVTLRKMSEYMPIKDLFYDEEYSDAKNLIETQEDRTGYGQ